LKGIPLDRKAEEKKYFAKTFVFVLVGLLVGWLVGWFLVSIFFFFFFSLLDPVHFNFIRQSSN